MRWHWGLWAMLACGTTEEVVEVDTAEPTLAADPTSLADAVRLDAMLAHLDAFAAIAVEGSGTRVIGDPAFDASADYAAAVLAETGLAVTRQPVPYVTWSLTADPLLTREDGVGVGASDYAAMTGSPAGDVTGPVVPVDVVLPPPSGANLTDSGCEADDFSAFPPGSIALIQRGTCTFATKVRNAADAGAVAVLIFNEGGPGRTGVVEGDLGDVSDLSLPVLGLSHDAGASLAQAVLSARVFVASETTVIEAQNVWADLPGTGPGVLVVGGHLDSVLAGPGIQDNGSGAALVLELAAAAQRIAWQPAVTVRFALWGAEEEGLIGSFAYVDALDEAALAAHVGNLNFDMVASPNGARFVYDGDASEGLPGLAPPAGSEALEEAFLAFFDERGLAWDATAFDGRSDYGPFVLAGIPAGGLFAGAEAPKSRDEASRYGGTAGEAFDACYHRACDDRDNLDEGLYEELAQAAGYATQRAGDTSVVAARLAPRTRLPRWSLEPGHLGEPLGCGRHAPVR